MNQITLKQDNLKGEYKNQNGNHTREFAFQGMFIREEKIDDLTIQYWVGVPNPDLKVKQDAQEMVNDMMTLAKNYEQAGRLIHKLRGYGISITKIEQLKYFHKISDVEPIKEIQFIIDPKHIKYEGGLKPFNHD